MYGEEIRCIACEEICVQIPGCRGQLHDTCKGLLNGELYAVLEGRGLKLLRN